MKASETEFKKIIEGTTQFFVPHYQRAYSWQQKQWSQLWDDLVGLVEDRGVGAPEAAKPTHFIGSMVTIPGVSVPQGVAKYVLIDGQQRITTLMLLLAALRDLSRELGDTRRAEMVHNLYLTNQYQEKLEHYKLLPTKADDPNSSDQQAFIRIISPEVGPKVQEHRATGAYEFFAKKVRLPTSPRPEVLIDTVTTGLMIVSIVLDRDDNPYTIFESLNAKGQPLSQADLIRNYFFMRIHQDEHEKAHTQFWQPMERMLADADMTEFFRQYLMRDGTLVKIDAVYIELKRSTDRRSQLSPLGQLQELHRYAEFFGRITHPEREPNTQVRKALTNLRRLNLGITASFLLNLYDDYASQRISPDVMAQALSTLENFLLRRFVCGIPTNVLNKIFPALYKQTSVGGKFSLDHLRAYLSERGYPTDEEFKVRLASARMYGGGDRRDKTKFILDRIEQSFDHKEVISTDQLTIEHVMPQTLSPQWREVLGTEVDEQFETYLHQIGNLTLTGYNAELSNDPFPTKRKQLLQSHIELNRYFQSIEVWTFEAIEARSRALAQRALSIWPSFRPQKDSPARPHGMVTGTKPSVVYIGDEKHEVKDWSDVLELIMTYLSESHSEQFPALQEDFPKQIANKASLLRTPRQLTNGYFYETNMSANRIFRLCEQVLDFVGARDLWRVETRN
jgi:uncharacterized protein with ParB-like and HNH nuclease domain